MYVRVSRERGQERREMPFRHKIHHSLQIDKPERNQWFTDTVDIDPLTANKMFIRGRTLLDYATCIESNLNNGVDPNRHVAPDCVLTPVMNKTNSMPIITTSL